MPINTTPRSSRVRGVLFISALLLVCSYTSGAQSPQSVSGEIVDDTNVKVPDAEIQLRHSGSVIAAARTSSSGGFSLDNLEPLSYQLSARRLGYVPLVTSFTLERGKKPEFLRLVMTPLPTELRQLIVAEPEDRLRDFYQRKSRGGIARFIDRAEIVRRDPVFISDMIRRIPGASVRAARGFGNIVRIRGCQPTIWIDGKRMRNVEIDEITDPDAVAGLEVYNSPTAVPIEFTDPVSSMCGVILIWTRSR